MTMICSSSLPMKENPTGKRNEKWVPYDIGIMIVDEDPTSLLFVYTLLQNCHFRVTSYEDPVEALANLYKKSDEFDLVIADLHMITMSGFSFVQQVAKKFKLPVITTCVDEDPYLLHQAYTFGSCFHLVKPITISSMEFVWKKSWKKKAKKPIDPPRFINFGKPNHPMFQGQHACLHEKQIVQIGQRSFANVDLKEKGNKAKSGEQARDHIDWNLELHRRFLVAVSLLGDDAIPTSIIGIMNVVGLTVKQVASHLQKHRDRVMKQQKETEPKLKIHSRSPSHCKSTVQRFPISLIPTGSKRSIHKLEDNPESSIRNCSVFLPNSSFQGNIQTGNTLSNTLHNRFINFEKAPVVEVLSMPKKQRKKSEAYQSPQRTPITYEWSNSNESTILNSINEKRSLLNDSMSDSHFKFVVDSTDNNVDSEIMRHEVKEPMLLGGEQWPSLDLLGFDGSQIEEKGTVDEGVQTSNDLEGLGWGFNYKDLTFDDALLAEMIEGLDKEQ